MAYTKTMWTNDNPPALDATNLMKIENKLEELDARPSGGGGVSEWNTITATLTYASADSPTFVANTSIDLTSVISVGMKLKLTQTTVKYFIVTAITSTTITLYGGTDYTLANATITLPYFSSMKAPFGFPLNPDKWSVIVTDTTLRQQLSPVQNTWYNLGSVNIAIPIGLWIVSFKVYLYGSRTSSGNVPLFVTLSSANNTESDSGYTVATYGNSMLAKAEQVVLFPRTVSLSSKSTLYFNTKTDTTGMESIANKGEQSPTTIKAVCAYL